MHPFLGACRSYHTGAVMPRLSTSRPTTPPAPSTPEAVPPTYVVTAADIGAALGLSARWVRDSSCPALELPSTGRVRESFRRYVVADVQGWLARHRVVPGGSVSGLHNQSRRARGLTTRRR